MIAQSDMTLKNTECRKDLGARGCLHHWSIEDTCLWFDVVVILTLGSLSTSNTFIHEIR